MDRSPIHSKAHLMLVGFGNRLENSFRTCLKQDKKQSLRDKNNIFLETSWQKRSAAGRLFQLFGKNVLHHDVVPKVQISRTQRGEKFPKYFQLGEGGGQVTPKVLRP
jgi:hypothetical protein